MLTIYAKSLHRRHLERHLERALPGLSGRILDAGSKNRRYDVLLKSADEIVAVDCSPAPGAEVVLADICALPFADESFDNVICIEVLEYVRDYERALDEFRRVLKKGGKLTFSAPFMSPVHGDASLTSPRTDHVRLTVRGWYACLAQRFASVDIKTIGGRWSIAADCVISWLKERGSLGRLFGLPPAAVLSVAIRIDQNYADPRFISGYFVQCIK